MPDRKVTAEEGKQFAQKLGVPYIETSAKTRSNIDEAFELLAKEVFTKAKKAASGSPSKSGTAAQKQKDNGGCEIQ